MIELVKHGASHNGWRASGSYGPDGGRAVAPAPFKPLND
jgi:hypothetical protein